MDPKILYVINIHHLNIQHLFLKKVKNTAAVTTELKNTNFQNSKPKNYSADLLSSLYIVLLGEDS